MEIRIFKTGAELNQSFTEWFKEIVAEKEKVTIALSGGSTPKSLFDYWAGLLYRRLTGQNKILLGR